MFGAAKVSRMFRGSGGGAASFGIMFVVGYLLDPVSVLRASYRTDTTATKSNALQYRGRQSIGAPGAAADDDVIAHTPQYLIVGVPKSGTSVLYFGLCGVHPNIKCAAFVKEPFYLTGLDAQAFAARPNATGAQQSFHRRYVETCFNLSQLSPTTFTSEASTSYFHSPLAADVIDLLPNKNIKLIVSFREPVARAYSWYQHQVRKGDAPASFREAVEPEVRAVVECAGSSVSAALRDSGGSVDEIEHIMECIEQAKATMQKDSGQRPKNYIFDSLYVGRYLQWKRRFGDRLHVVLYDDMRDDPLQAIDGTVRFLGLPTVSWSAEAIQVTRHEFQQGSRYEELPADDEVAAALLELFAPYNRLLALQLGRDIPWA